MGSRAQDLLLSALGDPDPEVAFLALDLVSFYCGVNDGSGGPFEDQAILNKGFKAQVRNTSGIIDSIRNISNECLPAFQARFNLLTKVLTK